MKTARLVTTNLSTGQNIQSDDIVLLVSVFEAETIYRALDLYLTNNPRHQEARRLYHSLGWNYRDYLPPMSNTHNSKEISER